MTEILSRRNKTELSKTTNEDLKEPVLEHKSTFTNKPPMYPKSLSLRNSFPFNHSI